MQPLTGAAAAGGITALVGTQMAVDRINKGGGINGRPIELVVEDYQSKPDTGRRKAEKLAVEDKIDAHQGGFLSNVCLACTPVWEEHKIVNMIGVCLDTTLTTSKCSRYTFRPFDYAPAQAVAMAPYLVSSWVRRGTSLRRYAGARPPMTLMASISRRLRRGLQQTVSARQPPYTVLSKISGISTYFAISARRRHHRQSAYASLTKSTVGRDGAIAE